MAMSEVTAAGHDPEACALLALALRAHVDDPWKVAVDVFGTLHDAGLRLVPSDQRALIRALHNDGDA